MSDKDGGPAFPHPTECAIGPEFQHLGMTLRDWFAGKAMAAIVQRLGVLSYSVTNQMDIEHRDVWSSDESEGGVLHSGTAFVAYEIADAMLAARKETR
jgi:hypothetical protein